MKRIYGCLILLASAMAVPFVAAQDAAIEIKEGDVEHWIEYYKRERGLGDETVTQKKDPPKALPQEAGQSEGRASSTRPATPDPDR